MYVCIYLHIYITQMCTYVRAYVHMCSYSPQVQRYVCIMRIYVCVLYFIVMELLLFTVIDPFYLQCLRGLTLILYVH